MTVIGPYRLLRALGGCEAGEVWSAFTADGRSVTVAMIDPARAGDPAWLARWRVRAEELVRDGVLCVVGADLSAPTPWMACAWDGDIGAGRLFVAQGLSYRPIGPVIQTTRTAPLAARAAVPGPRPEPVSLPVPPREPPTAHVPIPASVAELPSHLRPRGRGRVVADPSAVAGMGVAGQPPPVTTTPGPAEPPARGRRGRSGPSGGRRRRRRWALALTLLLLAAVGAAAGVLLARLTLPARLAPVPAPATTRALPDGVLRTAHS